MRSIVCHRVDIDELYPELGTALQHTAVSAMASESCSSIVFSVNA